MAGRLEARLSERGDMQRQGALVATGHGTCLDSQLLISDSPTRALLRHAEQKLTEVETKLVSSATLSPQALIRASDWALSRPRFFLHRGTSLSSWMRCTCKAPLYFVACHLWASSNTSNSRKRLRDGEDATDGSSLISATFPGAELSEEETVSASESSARSVEECTELA